MNLLVHSSSVELGTDLVLNLRVELLKSSSYCSPSWFPRFEEASEARPETRQVDRQGSHPARNVVLDLDPGGAWAREKPSSSSQFPPPRWSPRPTFDLLPRRSPRGGSVSRADIDRLRVFPFVRGLVRAHDGLRGVRAGSAGLARRWAGPVVPVAAIVLCLPAGRRRGPWADGEGEVRIFSVQDAPVCLCSGQRQRERPDEVGEQGQEEGWEGEEDEEERPRLVVPKLQEALGQVYGPRGWSENWRSPESTIKVWMRKWFSGDCSKWSLNDSTWSLEQF